MNFPDWKHQITQVCADHRIELHWKRLPLTNGRAYTKERILWAPPIESQVAYASALHELGHFLGHPVDQHRTIDRETLAWVWAKDHALEWTPTMERAMKVRLRTYFDFSIRTKRWLPPPDHPSWLMAGIEPEVHVKKR